MCSSLILNVYFARATPTYLISELVRLSIVALVCRNEVNDYIPCRCDATLKNYKVLFNMPIDKNTGTRNSTFQLLNNNDLVSIVVNFGVGLKSYYFHFIHIDYKFKY